MPFRSKSQARYMFSQHPKLAKEFAKKTPSIKKLPERVKKRDETAPGPFGVHRKPGKNERLFGMPDGSVELPIGRSQPKVMIAGDPSIRTNRRKRKGYKSNPYSPMFSNPISPNDPNPRPSEPRGSPE